MVLNLTLNAPPFSINKAYYRRGNRTTEYREWTQNIHDQLDSFSDEITAFREAFAPTKHALSVRIIHFLPSSKLYTKSGKISRRSKDLSNVEKTLIDVLFDPRYFKRGFSTLNLDDTFIVNLNSFKRESPIGEFYISVAIQLIPLEKSRSNP